MIRFLSYHDLEKKQGRFAPGKGKTLKKRIGMIALALMLCLSGGAARAERLDAQTVEAWL